MTVTPSVAAWSLAGLSALSLASTLNVLRPPRSPSALAVPAFFAGWLASELAPHVVVVECVVAGYLVARGGLEERSGLVGLAVLLLSCTVLALDYSRGGRAKAAMTAALADALGKDVTLPTLRPRWRDILLPFPVRHPDVVTTRNVVFARHGKARLHLDVFRRRDLPTGAPTFVYVHGGGWVIGQRRYQGIPLMVALAARGWTCFSVDYRLSPRATFPEHLIDVKHALAWVREHGAEHGADPGFLLLSGNSAGAHLAALAALTPNDPEYQPGFEEADTRVDGCVPLYGVFDFTDRHGHWPHREIRWFLETFVMKAKLGEAKDAYAKASPIDRAHEGAPPFLLVHGDRDTLAPVDESRRFSEALRGLSRAPVGYAEIPGAQHAFEIFPSLRASLVVEGIVVFAEALRAAHAARKS